MLSGVAPFGDKILCFSDAYDQYIAFWAYFRNAFLGKQDGLYSLAMTLGGNITGVFAYYSASIFNLLFLLFPHELLPISLSAALSVLFAFIYSKMRKTA